MEVFAFIGPPGTGKSDRALVVAYENRCACIIDDGILIYHNRWVAGASAKIVKLQLCAAQFSRIRNRWQKYNRPFIVFVLREY